MNKKKKKTEMLNFSPDHLISFENITYKNYFPGSEN